MGRPMARSLADSHSSYGTNTNTQAMASGSVDKASCTVKGECPPNSYCDKGSHRCRCVGDFVSVHRFINGSRATSLTPFCLRVAKLDDQCQSDEQCVVPHSVCQFQVPQHGGFNNMTNFFCRCGDGFHSEDREETSLTKDNQKVQSRPVCGEFPAMNNSWIGTFAIVCIMLLVILIGGFIGIIRFQRWKQRPMAATVTSLAAHGHTPHLMSSSPPPMGSVEAEFQNDFIQVFPMHHLEPLPDKNTHHEFVIK